MTEAQQERLKEWNAVWQKRKAEVQTILDVASFNQLCSRQKMQNFVVPANL